MTAGNTVGGLLTDFYSLTMAQGYWKEDRHRRCVFEFFFRRQPFAGGYAVFAGLETLLDNLAAFAFSADDIGYLRSLGVFDEGFLAYLRDFRFAGTLRAADEGTTVFPHEPLVRVEGSRIECQLVEGLLLNTLNFQTLVATKARRIWLASGRGKVTEFGMRRSQGPDGALSAARAAYIGGASGTSNTLAGKMHGIPVVGTMAHSWVMSFDDEREAFAAYARLYPGNCVFLIDTYNTLKSGIRCALEAGAELRKAGRSFGVRLDSGDIQYLSSQVRLRLDEAGFGDAEITVSGDLDESIISLLHESGAPVDTWGVGTRMVTAGSDPAFTGVYKMAAREGADGGAMTQVMKFSDNPEKTTNPGVKQVWRVRDAAGSPVADLMTLDDEPPPQAGSRLLFRHPAADYRHFYHTPAAAPQPLLKKRLENGRRLRPAAPLAEIRTRSLADFDTFDPTYKRLLNPHDYKVSVSALLCDLKLRLIKKHFGSPDAPVPGGGG